MDPIKIKTIVEAALMAAGRPLSVEDLQAVFGDFSQPERKQIQDAVKALQEDYDGRAIEIKEVASGFRVQVRTRYTEYISRLWEEKPPRYSRALMETLALIAYRQPITRGEIEEVRGVTVSTNMVRTLLERNWIRVIGHKDVPGRPAMFGTTREFLDYFGLKKLDELPSLRELQDIEDLSVQLEFATGDEGEGAANAPLADAVEEDANNASGNDSAVAAGDRRAPRMQLVSSQRDNDASAEDEKASAGDESRADVISSS